MANSSLLQDLGAELRVVGWLGLALAPLGLGIWYAFVRKGRRLFPPPRSRAVPWGFVDAVLAVWLTSFVWPALAYNVLTQIDFYHAVYGPGFAMPDPTEAAGAASELDLVRVRLWVQFFAAPLGVLTVPVLVWLTKRARAYQLGITFHRVPADIALACAFWLALTPVVLGIEAGFILLSEHVFHTPREPHPFGVFAKGPALPLELGAFAAIVLVAAPLQEELLFRGLLQRWFASTPWAAHVGVLAAVVLAAGPRPGHAGYGPLVFAALMVPGYLTVEHLFWRWLPQPNAARAIYASALLFAVSHGSWPDPIPLFVLGLGLGYLAQRTQSLIGPILVHAAFNAVGTILVLTVPAGP